MAELLNQEMDFDVGEDEQEETTVEMNEDGTDAKVADQEEIVVEETKKEKKRAGSPETEELENYSGKVKKRIDKLTARLRETQRREEAALEFAKNVQQQNQVLEERFQKTDGERLQEAQGRVSSHTLALKQVIKKAREEGDIDTETEAQQRLTSTMMEQQRIQDTTARRAQAPAPAPAQPQQAAPAPRAPEPDIKAEEWAESNEWFGQNTVMTHAVRGIHIDLVQKEGFDPSTDEYYHEIDRRIRDIFPSEFEPSTAPTDNRTRRSVQPVAPATRSSGVNKARRTVRLTPSQVAIAKRIGVPLEEYAKHVKD